MTTATSCQSKLQVETMSPFGAIVYTAGNNELRDHRLSELCHLAQRHRFIVLRGFKHLNGNEWIDYCNEEYSILQWNFGSILELKRHDAPKNYLFTNGNVPYHWDGAFAEQTPSFLFFQCLEAPRHKEGGESVFCDTTKVMQSASAEEIRAWQKIRIKYITEKLEHYGGEIEQDLISKHPVTGEQTIRFAEPLNRDSVNLNPIELEIQGLPADCKQEEFLREFIPRLYKHNSCVHYNWQAGDYLILDNHATLHGRTAYRELSNRHLQRIHLI